MKKIFLGMATVLVVSGLSFTACGSNPCPQTSKCSADPSRTDAQVKECQDAYAKLTTCKAETDAVSACTLAQQVCGTDNKTDTAKTQSNFTANCKTQTDAYVKCLLSGVDAGSTRDGG